MRENDDAGRLQRMRDERMRYEVLQMIYQAAGGEPEVERNAWHFALDLGVWHAELFRVVDWLAEHELIRYCGAGPVVCLTQKGADFVQRADDRRRSIREEDV